MRPIGFMLWGFVLGRCTVPVALQVELHGDAQELQTVKSLTLEVKSEAGEVIATATSAVTDHSVKLPVLRLPRGARYSLGIGAYAEASQSPLFIGGAPFEVSTMTSHLEPVPIMLVPIGHFGAFGAQPRVRRTDPGVVARANGEIWIVGGRDGQNMPTDVIEVYDPSRLAFVDGPKLATKRANAAVTLVATADKELIVVAGGETATGVATTIEIIDTSALQVRPPIAMQSARVNATIVPLPDGRVLIAGGSDEKGNPLTNCEVLTLNDFSSTVAPGLTPDGPLLLPAARVGGVGLTVNDRVFIVSGVGQTTVLELRIAERRFDVVATLGTSRTTPPAAATTATTMFVSSGGSDAIDVWQFSPAQTAKTPVRPPGARAHAQMALFPPETLRVLGGEDAMGPLKQNRIFEPASASLGTDELLVARTGHRALVVKDRLYVVGGSAMGPVIEVMSSCHPATFSACSQ